MSKMREYLNKIASDEITQAKFEETLQILKSARLLSGDTKFKVPARLKHNIYSNHILSWMRIEGMAFDDPYNNELTLMSADGFDQLNSEWEKIQNKNSSGGSKLATNVMQSSPIYNPTTGIISFLGKLIQIPLNTDQDELCKVLFKTQNSMNKVWSWDEVFEQWGDDPDNKQAWRKVYNAGREINKKIAIETGVKGLLIVKKLTIAINPSYIK